MPRRRDPNFITGHLCRFCGQLVPWGTILRIIRTVRLRVQRPTGPVKAPQFDEQSLPVHFECLAAVSTMRLG